MMGFCIFHQFSLTTMKKLLYFLALLLICSSHLSVAQRFRVKPHIERPHLEQAARLPSHAPSYKRSLIEIQKELTKFGLTVDPYSAPLMDAKARYKLMKSLRTNAMASAVSSTGPLIGPPPKRPSIGRAQPEAPATENLAAAPALQEGHDIKENIPCCRTSRSAKAGVTQVLKFRHHSGSIRRKLQSVDEQQTGSKSRSIDEPELPSPEVNLLPYEQQARMNLIRFLLPAEVPTATPVLNPPRAKASTGVSMSRASWPELSTQKAIPSQNLPTDVDFTDGKIEFTLKNGPQKNDYETIGQLRDDNGTLYEGNEIKEHLGDASFDDVREKLLEGKILELFKKSGYTESKLLLKFKEDGGTFDLFILKSPIDDGAPIPICECPEGGKLYIKAVTRML
jgi:hypothetical protein